MEGIRFRGSGNSTLEDQQFRKFLCLFVYFQLGNFSKNRKSFSRRFLVPRGCFKDRQFGSEDFIILPCRIPPFRCDLLPCGSSHIPAWPCREVTWNRCLDIDAFFHIAIGLLLPMLFWRLCFFQTKCCKCTGQSLRRAGKRSASHLSRNRCHPKISSSHLRDRGALIQCSITWFLRDSCWNARGFHRLGMRCIHILCLTGGYVALCVRRDALCFPALR